MPGPRSLLLVLTLRALPSLLLALCASPTLLPVTLRMEPSAEASKAGAPRLANGVIEIDVGATRVRLRGAIDEASVRCVLRLLGAIA